MSKRVQYQVPRILYIVIFLVLGLTLISRFIVPLILAGTVALALYPLQIKLQKRNWKPGKAAGLLTFIFTFVVSIPFMFFIAKGTLMVTDQLQTFAQGQKLENQGLQEVFTTLRKDVLERIQHFLERLPFANFLTDDKINQYIKSANTYLLDFFQSFAANIPAVVLFLVFMVFGTYSFLKYAGGIRNFFQNIFGFSDRKMDQLVGIFLRDARQVYFSNIVTGAIQSFMVATGVYFVTHSDWFLVFFVTLICSFIPVIGAAPMALLFSVVAYFQDNPSGAIILIILSAVTGVVDNILRPWLASFGESKAPAIVSLVFVIGGALWLGFPGLFIGLLVGSIIYDTLPMFWEEIHKTEVRRGISDIFSSKKDRSDEDLTTH